MFRTTRSINSSIPSKILLTVLFIAFLLEAASDAIGKRAITEISSNISVIAQEIKENVIRKISAAGYSSLHTQDVLLRNFTMDPASEQFANSVANDMQHATQLRIQGVNLDAEEANATKRGIVIANELRATADGIADAVSEIVGRAGVTKDAAAALVTAQMLAGKWDGRSLTAPVVFPGPHIPASVLVAAPGAPVPAVK